MIDHHDYPASLRRVATNMRRQHDATHVRHHMWAAIATILETEAVHAAEAEYAAARVSTDVQGNISPAYRPSTLYAVSVADAYEAAEEAAQEPAPVAQEPETVHHLAALRDLHGDEVKVFTSSLAQEPAVWLTVEGNSGLLSVEDAEHIGRGLLEFARRARAEKQ